MILVRPLGFSISDRMLKRAGLDYWPDLTLHEIDDLEEYLEKTTSPFFFFSSKAQKKFTEVEYPSHSLLIFGSESHGLPLKFHQRWSNKYVRIPQKKDTRCLNLSNSVAIGLYEALRQSNYSLLRENSKEKIDTRKNAAIAAEVRGK